MAIDHAHLARLDLNLLVAFDALLSERQVTRAAARIGVGQSAMSHSLGRLRALFGDELMIRNGAEMVPTPRAESLAAPVRRLLDTLQADVLAEAVFEPARARRSFVIGMSPSLEIALAPRLVALLQEEAPGLCVSVETASPEAMLAALDERRMDIALGAFENGGMEHKRRLLRQAEGYLCLHDPTRTGIGGSMTIADLARLPHVQVVATDSTAALLEAGLAALGFERRVIYRTPHVLALPFLLRENAALAVLCRTTALICAERFGLAAAALPVELPSPQILAVWHSSSGADPGHRWLREKLFALVAASGRPAHPAAGDPGQPLAWLRVSRGRSPPRRRCP